MNKTKEPSEIQKRLFALSKALAPSNRQFGVSIGQSPAYLSNVKDDISLSVVNNILATYPQVDLVWLVSGKGEMFIQEPMKEDLSNYIKEENRELKKENKELYAEVVLLRDKIRQLEEMGHSIGLAADQERPTYFRTLTRDKSGGEGKKGE